MKVATNTKIKVCLCRGTRSQLRKNVDATINLPLLSRAVAPVGTIIAVEQQLCKLMLSRSVQDSASDTETHRSSRLSLCVWGRLHYSRYELKTTNQRQGHFNNVTPSSKALDLNVQREQILDLNWSTL